LKSGALARWFAIATTPTRPSLFLGCRWSEQHQDGRRRLRELRMPATKYLDVGIHGLGGTGVGRYGTAALCLTSPYIPTAPRTIRAYQGWPRLRDTRRRSSTSLATTRRVCTAHPSISHAQYSNKLRRLRSITAANTGCGIETLPTSTGNGFAAALPTTRRTRKLHGRNPCRHRRHPRLHLYRVYNSPR